MVPNLGPPDILGLQFPEAFTTTSAGQDFWELKSKNIWRPKVGNHSVVQWMQGQTGTLETWFQISSWLRELMGWEVEPAKELLKYFTCLETPVRITVSQMLLDSTNKHVHRPGSPFVSISTIRSSCYWMATGLASVVGPLYGKLLHIQPEQSLLYIEH